MDNSTYYRKAGEYFGYPDCCIQEFVERGEQMEKAKSPEEFSPFTEKQLQVVDGAGFIPCKKCADKLLETGKRVDTLVDTEKRQAPYSYLEVKSSEEKEEETFKDFLFKKMEWMKENLEEFTCEKGCEEQCQECK